jgi:hypothetical protein
MIISMLLLMGKTRADVSPNIILDDKLDSNALRILLEHGLWSRCGRDLESQWKAQLSADHHKRQEDKRIERANKQSQIDSQIARLEKSMPFHLIDAAMKVYPSVPSSQIPQLSDIPWRTLAAFKKELLETVLGTQVDYPRPTDDAFAQAEGKIRTALLK